MLKGVDFGLIFWSDLGKVVTHLNVRICMWQGVVCGATVGRLTHLSGINNYGSPVFKKIELSPVAVVVVGV